MATLTYAMWVESGTSTPPVTTGLARAMDVAAQACRCCL
jgi:hypothetical protein